MSFDEQKKSCGLVLAVKWLTAYFSILVMTSLINISLARADNAQLQQVQAQLQALVKSVSADKLKQTQLQSEINQIERQLNQLNRQMSQLDAEMQTQQTKINNLQADKRTAQQTLLAQESSLAEQLRTAYMLGKQQQLQLLLNQQNPADFSRMLTYYEYVNKARVTVIERSRTSIETINELEQRIQHRSAQLAELNSQQTTKRNQFLDRQAQRRRLLGDVTKTIAQTDAEIQQLKNDERRLQRLVQGLQGVLDDIPPELDQQPFAKLKGRLRWPTQGKVQRRFGQRRPASDMRWNGVRILGTAGQAVQAVSYGRVAFADWMAGFGLLVIIDHRDGYMSLYGHNQQLFVEVGDWINAGEQVASLGNTGGQTENALYFELRQQGRPINPTAWCR